MSKLGRVSRNASLTRTGIIAADKTLLTSDSGTTWLVDASSAGNFTITLPEKKDGLYFTFILSDDSNAAAEVLLDTGDSNVQLQGKTIVQADSGADTKDTVASQKVGFGDAAKLGDIIEIICGGVHWSIIRAEASVSFITSFS
tara:strand:- start:621 stop:1049 length:429 start_codon:yes stop_codon:yes gene_type:complete